MKAWLIEGSYLESCNCEAICPCRRVGGVAGGRSTYGVCFGVLTWWIESGEADGVDLANLGAALVYWYDDDEPASPWRFVVHLDERARPVQHDALASIFTGRVGGPHVLTLPWVRKPAELQDVRSSLIETVPGKSVRIATRAEVVLGDPVATDTTVTCIVPGHDRLGAEHYAERLMSNDAPFVWELTGNCAYKAPFRYVGP
jgi:hypothetical protein